MRYALVGPNGVDRIAEPGTIDPTVATKAGWSWLEVVDESQPQSADGQTIEQTVTVEANRVVRGWSVTEALTLAALKTHLDSRIDSDAEVVRLRYITPGAGMAMTYREKLEQAENVLAGGQEAADALTEEDARSAYPTLAASIGIEASSLWACAQLVWAKYQAWAQVSHDIEKARLGGKSAVAASSDHDSARAAYAAVTWPE